MLRLMYTGQLKLSYSKKPNIFMYYLKNFNIIHKFDENTKLKRHTVVNCNYLLGLMIVKML